MGKLIYKVPFSSELMNAATQYLADYPVVFDNAFTSTVMVTPEINGINQLSENDFFYDGRSKGKYGVSIPDFNERFEKSPMLAFPSVSIS